MRCTSAPGCCIKSWLNIEVVSIKYLILTIKTEYVKYFQRVLLNILFCQAKVRGESDADSVIHLNKHLKINYNIFQQRQEPAAAAVFAQCSV